MTRREEAGRLLRFAVVGGSNTALTYLLFVLLSRAMDQRLAYTLVFALGIVYSALLTRSFVFRSSGGSRRILLFAAFNVGVYGVGLLVLQLLRARGMDSAAVNGLITLSVTAPLNYLGGRALFTSPAAPLTVPEAPVR